MHVCRRFDEAATALEAAAADDKRLLKDVRTYLDTCRTNSTGTYIYTYVNIAVVNSRRVGLKLINGTQHRVEEI